MSKLPFPYKTNFVKQFSKFDFVYFKKKYNNDLLYLYKIVHNKSLIPDDDKETKNNFNNDEFNNFCTFVWNIKNEQYKMKRIYVKLISLDDVSTKPVNLTEEKIDEMWNIFNFLKQYDYTDMFFKHLTFAKLENYLISTLV